MLNFIQPGKVLTFVAGSGGVVSGSVVVEGLIVGIAATSAAEGEEYECALGQVYELPKNSAEAWAIGDAVYVTPGGIMTTTSTANTKAGIAVAVAENPSGLGQVRLNDSF